MSNIIVGIFAVLLCLVNAVLWTFVSQLPIMGVAWLAAAVGCLRIHHWTVGD